MRIKSYLLCLILLGVVTGTSGQTFPLQPVPADSVSVEGFFWHDQMKYVTDKWPQLQPKSIEITAKNLKKIPSLTKQWQKLMLKASPTGIDNGNVKATCRFVELCLRLAQLTGDSRYTCAAEQMLVNALCQQSDPLAGRTLLNLPENIYATSGNHLFVNFPIRSSAHITTPDLDVKLRCVTSSPWFNDEYILWLNFGGKQRHMTLHLRLPSWMDTEELTAYRVDRLPKLKQVKTADGLILSPHVENGFLIIEKEWCDSDYVGIQINTPIYRISDPVRPSFVAFQKGSVLYRLLNLPAGMSVRPKDAVHSEFDADRHTNVLSAPYYDADGKQVGTFMAEPYLFHRTDGPGDVYVPKEPVPTHN